MGKSLFQRMDVRKGMAEGVAAAPARGWQRKHHFWQIVAPPAILGLLLLTALAALMEDRSGHSYLARDVAMGALAVALLWAGALWAATMRVLWMPLSYVRNWAAQVRGGQLAARIPGDRADGEFAVLVADINGLGERLHRLTEEQAKAGASPVMSRWLGILNAITGGIASSQDMNELLPRFLFTLHSAGEVRAGIVRLLTNDGHLQLVASIGLPDTIVERERRIALDWCFCGQAVGQRTVSIGPNLKACCASWGCDPFPGESLVLLAIPLRYDGRVVGLYNLFMERERVIGQQDVEDLLLGFGQHLGAAIEKMRLQDEHRQLALLQERMAIAHELHDSLAQTLASLRIQVQVLGETLGSDPDFGIHTEFKRLTAGLEVAHREVRGLIRNFRAAGAERGLMRALDATIRHFRAETGITVYVQKDWHGELPLPYETHVLRVIQEALSNVRKHAHAETVRVFLQSEPGREYRVLIEDDGEGPGSAEERADRDEGHFGQAIMRERAHAIGGELRVEYEAGEGTRVWLTFPEPGLISKEIGVAQ